MPDAVSDRQAVFAEPLAAAVGISEQVDLDEGTRLAVIGDGKLGLLCAIGLRSKTSNVTSIGKHENKLRIAEKHDVETKLLSEIGHALHGSFDVVVEASGSESGFATALDLVKPRGMVVLKSTFHGTPTWAASRVVVEEITIVGSRCGRFAPALEMLADGRIAVEDLIDGEMALADGVQAMEKAGQKGSLKILLRP